MGENESGDVAEQGKEGLAPVENGDTPPPTGDEGGSEGGEGNQGFIEVDGTKYQPDPENPDEALKDNEGNPVPFKEVEVKPKEQEIAEPPVRDKKDFIIDRLRQTRDDKKENIDDDDEVDPEDEARIIKVVEKKFGVKLNKIDEGENERELDNFFSKPDNAIFKDKETQIRNWWKHPSRNHLPIESVAYEVAGKDLLKIGAKKAQEADVEANKTGSGGHTSRNAMPKKNAWDESPEEFAKHQQSVREKS